MLIMFLIIPKVHIVSVDDVDALNKLEIRGVGGVMVAVTDSDRDPFGLVRLKGSVRLERGLTLMGLGLHHGRSWSLK